MILTISSRSTALPVSIAEVKDYLKIEYDEEDLIIKTLIVAARDLAENITKRTITPTSYVGYIDKFPNSTVSWISLPKPPLSTASSNVVITYVEDTTAGTLTTWDATAYTVDFVSEPARVYPSYDNSYPTNVRLQRNAVSIAYKAGYSTVPEPIKTWMYLRVSVLYEYRNPIIEGRSVENLKRGLYDGLLDPYILPEVF